MPALSMHSSSRQLFVAAAIAFFFTVAFTALAQDTKSAGPAAPEPPVVNAIPGDPGAAPAEPEPKAEAPLRRLDEPANKRSGPRAAAAKERLTSRADSNERIAIGHDVSLAKDETAETVVAIFGSATSAGKVSDAVVSILGNTRVTGPVGDTAVAVLGSTYINSRVGGEAVAVLGDIELGPEAEVMGDVVSIGGTVTRHANAVVHGNTQNVAFGHLAFGDMEGLRAWFSHAVLLGRPLAIGPHLGWAWMVALCFLALYVVLALLFRPAVAQCTVTLETRPGYSILATVLTVLLIPVTIVLLCLTVVGIALVPFVFMALLVAALLGKVVMLEWLGRRITRLMGDGAMSHAATAVLVGGIVVLGLYLVPIVGFLVFKLLGWLGVGVVIYTLILRMKREARPVMAGPVMAPAAGIDAGGGFSASAGMPPPVVSPLPPVVSALTLPRAGFWIRVLALLIDVIVVGLVISATQKLLPRFLHTHFGPGLMPALAIYGAVLWKMRGTTIGGIVCGLKVVRLDDRPIDWPTAVVRALGCFLSIVVAGLGFIWVAFDEEKQSWHDKIAGTTVVRVPKGVALV